MVAKKKSKSKRRGSPLKLCPYCKGKHRKVSAYNACKRSKKVESWPK